MKWNDIFRLGQKKKTDSPKIVRVDYVGKKNQPALLYIPYGMFMNFPDDGLVGILADQGNEESLVALPTDIENREKLNDKEVGYGIPTLKNRLYFYDDESMSLQNDKGSVSIDKDGVITAKNDNGSVTIDAAGIHTFNGGSIPSARKEDAVKSTTEEDPDFWAFWTAMFAIIKGAPINEPGNGSPSAFQAALIAALAAATPDSLTGKITEGTDDVLLP